MCTKVVFELDDIRDANNVIMSGLLLAFRDRFTDQDVSVVPKVCKIDTSSLFDAFVDAANAAHNEIQNDPKVHTCIYLSPRMMRLDDSELSSTIFIVRNRERLQAANIQVLYDEALEDTLKQNLRPLIARVHAYLFRHNQQSKEDALLAATIGGVIQSGYFTACQLLHDKKH